MTKEELHSYRLTSMEEPTDEMLQAIMQGVADSAIQSGINARRELDRRFHELKMQIAQLRQASIHK